MAAANGKRRVTFSLTAPDAREVTLCGSFNEWDRTCTPLKKDKSGVWKTQLMLAPGEYEYRLCVDGEWVDDPSADRCVPNPFGSRNCVKTVAAK
jgi:1,4-alpha-glucan branching enzyme